jgi:hypothetical protein
MPPVRRCVTGVRRSGRLATPYGSRVVDDPPQPLLGRLGLLLGDEGGNAEQPLPTAASGSGEVMIPMCPGTSAAEPEESES